MESVRTEKVEIEWVCVWGYLEDEGYVRENGQ